MTHRITVGAVYTNGKTDTSYEVVSIDSKGGFTAKRLTTGKTVKVSSKLLARCKAATEAGQALLMQTNGPEGISYTVAIEAGVVHALGLRPDTSTRTWRA